MTFLNPRLRSNPFLLFVATVALVPVAFAGSVTIYENDLPISNVDGSGTSGPPAFRADAAAIYGTTTNCLGGTSPCSNTVEPFILGDQFSVSGPTTVTSVTVFEISNTPTTGSLSDSNPTSEFSNISLLIGPDSDPLSFVSSSYTPTNVQNTDSSNYESISSATDFYIWQLTFSGLSVNLPAAGLYDFAIDATPNASNSFALLMSDPADQLGGPAAGQPNLGFLYLFEDASGGTQWVAEEQYGAGDISGFSNPDNIDVVGNIQGTATPEPATFGLLGLALGGVWLGARRRVSRPAA